jgi:hypothetical protein
MVSMLLAWMAVMLLFFFFIGETPARAEQIESHSHASSNLPCPKCKKPLTVVSVQEATCTVRGFTEYNCDECNQYHEIVYGELAPHDMEQISTQEATCTQPATITERCKDCQITVTGDVKDSVLGHDYQDEVTPPTCSAIGYTDHTCSRCGDTYRDSQTATIPHTYTETMESEPTCQTVGFMRHTCELCDHSYTEEIPVVEHDWTISVVEATHSEQGFTVYSCRFCQTMKRENFTEQRPYDMVWTVQEATCTANGLKIGYCSDGCVHTETVVIPRLDHDFGEWITIRRADEAGDGIESRICSRCELSEMKYIPYDHTQEQVKEPVDVVGMNWLALGSLAILSIVAVIFVIVFLLLLLEHARRDRVKRSRRIPPSETYSNE